MKGLVLVELLDKIEKLTGKRIHELFDLICGTSTGGIVALAVGGLQKPLKNANAKVPRPPKFDGSPRASCH
jgi:patatin-like phospholipase/acyl hydrolase